MTYYAYYGRKRSSVTLRPKQRYISIGKTRYLLHRSVSTYAITDPMYLRILNTGIDWYSHIFLENIDTGQIIALKRANPISDYLPIKDI